MTSDTAWEDSPGFVEHEFIGSDWQSSNGEQTRALKDGDSHIHLHAWQRGDFVWLGVLVLIGDLISLHDRIAACGLRDLWPDLPA